MCISTYIYIYIHIDAGYTAYIYILYVYIYMYIYYQMFPDTSDILAWHLFLQLCHNEPMIVTYSSGIYIYIYIYVDIVTLEASRTNHLLNMQALYPHVISPKLVLEPYTLLGYVRPKGELCLLSEFHWYHMLGFVQDTRAGL